MLDEHSRNAQDLLLVLDDMPEDRYRQVLGDPVVRVAVDGSVSYFRMNGELFPEDELEAALAIASTNAHNESWVPPLAEGSKDQIRVYDRRAWPWIWSSARVDDDPLGDCFRRLVSKHHRGLVLTTPDVPAQKMLVAGAKVLHILCPRLAESAMSHVHLIAVVNTKSSVKVTSLTDPRIPGVFFLSPSVLTNPWQAAEYLLHEAMHLKFVDLENTHSLFSEDYDEVSSPKVRPHWNKIIPGGVSEWPIHRVLTVLHVYTCLALFFTNAASRSSSLEAEYGPLHLDPIEQARRSFDRAHYLRYELERHEEFLGFAGRLFIRWLGEILQSLDNSAPPKGSYVHLLLDLYNRETDEIRTNVTALGDLVLPDDAKWGKFIRKVAKDEISRALVVLSMTSGAAAPANRVLQNHDKLLQTLEASEARFSDSASTFLAVRNSIFQTLSSINSTAYLMPSLSSEMNTASEVVQTMVESSCSELRAVKKLIEA